MSVSKVTKPYDQKMVNPQDFDSLVKKLREFFANKKFKETFPQPRLSIMAACEDPKTITPFYFSGVKYPLSQTNQMWLEHDILKQPELEGIFCLTTSYRNEPNPIEGRHEKIFPMFEAEHLGNYENLLTTISELCVHLKLVDSVESIPFFNYDDLCEKYNVDILESEHELELWKEYGDVVGIKYFPKRTSPFWNMKQVGTNKKGEDIYNKCDFIICGQETIGSAERETDVEKMRNSFYNISNGEYAKILISEFDETRVTEELEDYLSLNFIERWGFGCGFTRLLRAMKIKNLI
jgi:aspartyl/asparaginyl-tRNA synthetase